MVPIGTLTHECGHIAVAKYFGRTTQLHYASMDHDRELYDSIQTLYYQNKWAIDNDIDYEQKELFRRLNKSFVSQNMWISWGGPIQTMLFGFLGCIILWVRRKKRQAEGFTLWDWGAVFLALFWLREIANLVLSLSKGVFCLSGNCFGGDEKRLSIGLGLWEGTLPILFGLIGLTVSLWVVFRVVPISVRFTFILSGFSGGSLGWLLWMKILGPVLLP